MEPVGRVTHLVPGLAEQVKPESANKTPIEVEGKKNFGDLFANLIDSVNDVQMESVQIQDAFLNGEPVELHQIMIKAEEAGLAMDLLLEIRNRLVNAYNELLRMPV
jgi:flagellar hook-basal body complex protein FliE